MFYLIYNFLSIFILLPVIAYHYYRSASRGRKAAFAERFGFLSTELKKLCKGRKVIWLHAVSVGEANAAKPLLKGLRETYREHLIVVSTTTETGRGVASAIKGVDAVFYFPFDFLPSVKLALSTINPELVIIMETEIWPNFNREAVRRNIPLLLANGRISDRSFKSYLRFAWFFRHPLGYFSKLCMQSEADSERIVAIGAPAEKTVTAGNIKYDINLSPVNSDEKNRLKRSFGIPKNCIVIAAASTHAGEEALLTDAFLNIEREFGDIFLIIAPRHPERGEDVAGILSQKRLSYRRRSSDNSPAVMNKGEVLLADTIGELLDIYRISDIAFVGGSLVPTGGHNLLEPAALGIPTIFGEHTSNFREIRELVLRYGAGVEVAGQPELFDALRSLTLSADLRVVLGNNGLKLMRDSGGASARHLAEIAAVI